MTIRLLRQKVTAIIVLAAICLALLPVNVFANNEEFTTNELRYVIVNTGNKDEKCVELAKVDGTAYSGEINVPETVIYNNETYTVTGIKSDAFANATGVTKVTLPNSITSIPSTAFINCTSLRSVSMGNAVMSIGAGAFGGCSALNSLTIPDTVTSIGVGAFAGLGATSLRIPASVGEGDAGLYGYKHLDGVTFADNSLFKLDQGVLYYDKKLVVALVDSIENYTVLEGTTTIAKNAFANFSDRGGQTNGACQSLKTVTLPSSLETIEEGAFGTSSSVKKACTALESVKFADDAAPALKEIGTAAFGGCTKLSDITLPDSLTTIGESAFQKTALTSAVIPEGVKEIPQGAFSQVRTLKTIVIPASVETIGRNAFSGLKDGTSDTTLIMQGTTSPMFDEKAFGVKDGSGVKPAKLTVIVPEEAKDSYAGENGFFKDYFKEDDTGTGTGTTVSITLDKTSASMKVGGTVELTCTYTELKNAELEWSSDKEAVATVDNGVVSGVSAGAANITASLMLNGVSAASATCKVTVTEKSVVPTPDPVRPVNPMYGTSTPNTKHGTVTVSPSRAPSGTLVTITAEPDKGYVLDDLTVTDSKGNSVKLTEKDDGVFTFRMPSGGATVDAKFVRATSRFVDVADNAWYRDAVEYVYEAGLMNGVGGGKFNPLGETTRGMIVTILYRMEGSPRVNSDGAYWWSDARAWAMDAGVSDGTNMTDNITREQFAAMLYRFASANGIDTSERGSLSRFADSANVSDWAKDAMQWAVAEGIIGGANGKLNPKGLATRAEVAAMFMRFDKLFG